MIDLDSIEKAAQEALKFDSAYDAFLDRIEGGPKAILALVKEAKRYRWLRDHGSCPFSEADPVWEEPESFDAEIDNWMAME